jgi:hypothetical protein
MVFLGEILRFMVRTPQQPREKMQLLLQDLVSAIVPLSQTHEQNFMQKQILFYSIAVLNLSALLQLPAGAKVSPQAEVLSQAEVLPQNTWQQSYTPTRLQWLFVNLRGRGERTPCGVSDLDGKPRAWYEWQSPNAKDQQLSLSVFTRANATNSIPDRNFCMATAFENLKSEAFKLKSSPPPVELRHFQLNRNGQSLMGTYKCLVPAATTATDLNIGRFETLCR